MIGLGHIKTRGLQLHAGFDSDEQDNDQPKPMWC